MLVEFLNVSRGFRLGEVIIVFLYWSVVSVGNCLRNIGEFRFWDRMFRSG